jgi:hypothetical protein
MKEEPTLTLTKVICKKLKYEPISIDLLFKGYRAKLCITENKDEVIKEIQRKLDRLFCKFVKIKIRKLIFRKKWVISILVPFNRKNI